jgi:hypothetical protein
MALPLDTKGVEDINVGDTAKCGSRLYPFNITSKHRWVSLLRMRPVAKDGSPIDYPGSKGVPVVNNMLWWAVLAGPKSM